MYLLSFKLFERIVCPIIGRNRLKWEREKVSEIIIRNIILKNKCERALRNMVERYCLNRRSFRSVRVLRLRAFVTNFTRTYVLKCAPHPFDPLKQAITWSYIVESGYIYIYILYNNIVIENFKRKLRLFREERKYFFVILDNDNNSQK